MSCHLDENRKGTLLALAVRKGLVGLIWLQLKCLNSGLMCNYMLIQCYYYSNYNIIQWYCTDKGHHHCSRHLGMPGHEDPIQPTTFSWGFVMLTVVDLRKTNGLVGLALLAHWLWWPGLSQNAAACHWEQCQACYAFSLSQSIAHAGQSLLCLF